METIKLFTNKIEVLLWLSFYFICAKSLLIYFTYQTVCLIFKHSCQSSLRRSAGLPCLIPLLNSLTSSKQDFKYLTPRV